MGFMSCRKVQDPINEFFEVGPNVFSSPFFKTDRALVNLKGFWYPTLDVEEDKESITIKADLPGLRKEDISITVDGNILTIRGERKSETEKKEKDYHRAERFYGVFERSLDLGTSVDQSKIKAKYSEGVLEVILPKTEKAESKQVVIE